MSRLVSFGIGVVFTFFMIFFAPFLPNAIDSVLKGALFQDLCQNEKSPLSWAEMMMSFAIPEAYAKSKQMEFRRSNSWDWFVALCAGMVTGFLSKRSGYLFKHEDDPDESDMKIDAPPSFLSDTAASFICYWIAEEWCGGNGSYAVVIFCLYRTNALKWGVLRDIMKKQFFVGVIYLILIYLKLVPAPFYMAPETIWKKWSTTKTA